MKVYPPKYKKNFCPNKILANFQIKSLHFNGGTETMYLRLTKPVEQTFKESDLV